MDKGKDLPESLSQWLAYIEALHPKSIEMGLDRITKVAERLQLTPDFKVITVAGTNGKGSCCAMLASLYIAAGYQVGCYSSPHLLRYNERVRVNHIEASDEALCRAFEAVEQARAEIELTYFEMATLAAIWHFMQQSLDVAILEVGLGGRLDAVNIFDADCAIVTNVDMDHMAFLGDTREAIGAEKAGVYRANQVAICGELTPPNSLIDAAQKIGADLKLIGQHYHIQSGQDTWTYKDEQGALTLPRLSLIGDYQMQNAAAVIYAVRAMHQYLPVNHALFEAVLPKVTLPGRFQYLRRAPDVITDVAHNPQAAQALSSNLTQLQTENNRLIAVFSMLSDKDIASVVDLLKHQIDEWHIAQIDHPRAASVQQLQQILLDAGVTVPIKPQQNIAQALLSTYKTITKNDKIIVFGSFFTVGEALQVTLPQTNTSTPS